ncbi:MAG: dihydroneopterin aldolase [Microlunatus sp.]
MMTTDQIVLTGIVGRGHHGVYAFERDEGQDFVVDVAATMDLGSAAKSDDLEETIDYSALATAVVADIERDPVNLIEKLADRIARTCLRDSRITTVTVTVHKPQAPMPVRVGDVAVTLTRSNAI